MHLQGWNYIYEKMEKLEPITKLVKTLAIIVLVICYVGSTGQKTFWKTRCLSTQDWADSLYSENLRLADTITYYKYQKR